MRHPRQARDDYAEGHPAGEEDTRRLGRRGVGIAPFFFLHYQKDWERRGTRGFGWEEEELQSSEKPAASLVPFFLLWTHLGAFGRVWGVLQSGWVVENGRGYGLTPWTLLLFSMALHMRFTYCMRWQAGVTRELAEFGRYLVLVPRVCYIPGSGKGGIWFGLLIGFSTQRWRWPCASIMDGWEFC